jgi:cytochrome b6-f complex iron-sulfur subunit
VVAQITSTPPPRKAKQDRAPEEDPGIWRMNRRNLLSLTGWLAFLSFILASTIGALRFMFPRVLFEPPTKFKAGFPQDYVVGEVSDKYKDEHRVWIVRDNLGFYSLIAICTHLGCTPRWLPTDNKFKCPCHGSGYYKSGVNFEGPAPRPLERAYIGLTDDGQLEVDTSITFHYELGQWGKPGSFLSYTG